MSRILGYIGQTPCNDFICECISKLSSQGQKNLGLATSQGDKITTLYANNLKSLNKKIQSTHDMLSVIAKVQNNTPDHTNLSPRASDSFAVCCDTGQMNEENISLPFNLFKKAVSIDDTMLYVLEYLDTNSKTQIIKSTTPDLVGDLTFAYFDKQSDAIYCQMGASPIVIGLGNNFNVFASEIGAISNLTNRFIILQKGEKAKITRDKIIVLNNKNHKIKKSILKFNKDIEYNNDFYLSEQLFTLSSNISSLIDGVIKNDKICYNKLKINRLNSKIYSKIVLVSDEPCYCACLSAKKILTILCDLPTEIYCSDEYVRENKNIDNSTLLIAVSILGENTSLTSCVNFAKSCNAKVIGITGNSYSYLARLSDYVIKTPEANFNCDYNISLNTFSLIYLSICIFAIHFGHILGTVSDVYMDVAIKMVQMLPGKIAQSTKSTPLKEKLAYMLIQSENVVFTGCGIDYPVAVDSSKMLSKIAKKSISTLPLFDLESAYIDNDTTIVAIISNKDYLYEFKNILKEAKVKGAKIIVVTNCNIEDNLDCFEHILCMPDSLPIYNILPSSVGLYSIALLCEKNQDTKQKSVAI